MKLKKIFAVFFAICMLLPMAVSAKVQELTIDGDHGKLAANFQTPDNLSQYPIVMMLHGFGDTKESKFWIDMANKLEAKGIASIRFDFNGHGKSEGKFIQMTIPNEIVDARKVFDYVRTLPEVTTISMVGGSQGGVVTAMLAGELGSQVKSIALLAAAATLRDDCARGMFLGTSFDPENMPLTLKIGKKGPIIGRAYLETLYNLPIYETAEKYKGSVCLVHGLADTLIPYTESLRLQHIYPDNELHLLKGVNHSYTPDPTPVIEIVVDFFERHVR